MELLPPGRAQNKISRAPTVIYKAPCSKSFRSLKITWTKTSCAHKRNRLQVTHLQTQSSPSSHVPFARNPWKTACTICHTGCNQTSQVWSRWTHWAWFYLCHLPSCQVSSTQWHFHKTWGGKQWKSNYFYLRFILHIGSNYNYKQTFHLTASAMTLQKAQQKISVLTV